MTGSGWGAQLRRRARRTRQSRRAASVALYVALGIAAAFVVSALARAWDPGAGETGAADPGQDEASEVRVEVLNGSGGRGLARSATRRLRGAGFDVVFFGNAARFDHDRSVALDRTGDIERAQAVAAALGIDSVATAVDSSLLLEVTVVIGDDWPPTRPEPEAGWLDRLRGVGDSVATDTTPDG